MDNLINEETKPNFKHIGNSFYLVRTQAGFRQALKQWYGEGRRYKGPLDGFPKLYPSIVSFSYGYCGYDFVRANCLPVNCFKDIEK